MSSTRFVWVWGFVFAISCSAETKWTRLKSDNFEMFTTAGQGSSRELLKNFEQVRSFFNQALARNPGKDQPVYIIGFNSEREYAPYKFNDFAIAYYHPGADRDYIVMSKVGYDLFPTAVHEYVHLVVQHSNLKFPPWLNEGIAELYSTMKPSGKGILVGMPINGRLLALQQDRWVPLQTIVAADHNSPYYNEKKRAGSLYNEGWALVHMLALSDEYRPKYSALLTGLADGGDSVAVLERVYGKSIAQLDKELQAYTRTGQFRPLQFNVSAEKSKDAAAEPAQEFDLNLALADLMNRPGKEQEARERLEKLAQMDAQRPESWAGLAYLAWRKRDTEEAEKYFAKAFELGDRNPRLLWDYGRIARGRHPEEALKALETLQEIQPERLEVKLEIASMHLQAQRGGKAYQILVEIKKANADDAARLLTLLAYAQIAMKAPDAARGSLEQAEKYAKTDFDREEVGRLKDYLERVDRAAATRAAVEAPRVGVAVPVSSRTRAEEEDVDKPEPGVVLRRVTNEGKITEYATAPVISGTFAEFVCAESPRVVVNTASGRKTFLIVDPKKITVVGREGGNVDLTCGAQAGTALRVEYGPSTVAGVDGNVIVLYFDGK